MKTQSSQSITPNAHERNEWLRMAKDAEKHGMQAIADKFAAAAMRLSSAAEIPLHEFDALQAEYRSWLVDGFKRMTQPAGHTPGPWAVRSIDHSLRGKIFFVTGVNERNTRIVIADCGIDRETADNRAECEANARLIAAAPELLEALKGTVAMLELLNATGSNDPIEARVFKARAAIARATGQ